MHHSQHQQDWRPEYTKQAHDYLRALIYGPIDEAEVARLHHLVRRAAEQRFATACWFKRHILGDYQLPGMLTTSFSADYRAARKAFPRS